jgi:hypothetical protein
MEMKILRSFLFLIVALIGLSMVNVSAQSYAPAQAGSVHSMNEQVYHKIRGMLHYNVFDNITWQVNGNTVTLSGKTVSLGAKSEAGAVVRDIPGITVVNNIQELPPSPADDRIRRAAFFEFTNRGPAQYFGYPNPDVHIVVENGHITLEGYVARKSDSDTLNVLAHGIPGVFTITNNLVVGERKF